VTAPNDNARKQSANRMHNTRMSREKTLFPTLYPTLLPATQYKVGELGIALLRDLALHSRGKINNKKPTSLTGHHAIQSALGTYYIEHENIAPENNWLFKGSIILAAIKQLHYDVLWRSSNYGIVHAIRQH
jgi:hypothetical protein